MFNNSLKKEALKIHKSTLKKYNASYEIMKIASEELYQKRKKSVELIKDIEKVVNSIANTPKEYNTKMGEVGKELTEFFKTEKYAQKAYESYVKVGANIIGGAAAGVGIAAMAPAALMSIATTFGTASTGAAINALSGAAAQKAAIAWIGRTFAGFAVKGGAGMAAGQAFLALAGPVGYGIAAANAGIALFSLNGKNKKLADKAVSEAKEIAKAKEAVEETTEKVIALKRKTEILFNDIYDINDSIIELMNADYSTLSNDKQIFLGTVVNNTLSMSILLNETVK